jgi:hypothetical protein
VALADIFEAIEGEFQSLGVSVAVRDGGEWLGANDSPPRVVFVPTEEILTGAAELHYDGTFTATGTPRPLAQRECAVEVHVWGRDRAATDELVGHTVNAIRRSAGAAYRLASGSWKQQDSAALTQYGRAYVFQVTFLVPVLEVGPRFATIGSTDESDAVIESVP